uniref:Ig-like domain-containing protein n=1 Tax=Vombatus ursinus TaxID=29139 RepID=A0A4X2L1L3_VOMUR
MVTVSSATSTAPSVFPLVPCCDSNSEDLSLLGCLVSNYFPEPVTVSWNSGVLDEKITTFPAAYDSKSGLYTTTSQLTSSDLSSQEFTCSVDHLPTKTKIKKSVSLKACGPVTIIPPTVKLFHSSCDPRGDAHSTIQLLCLISGFSPANVQVNWLVDGQEAESLFPYTTRPKREGGLTFTSQSELNITQGQWMSSKTYTCQVKHNGNIYEDSAQRCSDTDPRGISAYLTPPSAFDLYVSKAPLLTCLIVDLASADNAKVIWSRESGGTVSPSSPVVKKQYNGTVTVTSTLPVQANDWVEGETYTCRLEHPDLPKALIRTISKAPGKRIAPDVYMFPPSEEEKGNTVSLTCLVQNFFPSDIAVQWLYDNKEDHTGHHTTTRPYKDHGLDPSFFLYSRLVVNRSHWQEGHTYTCRVVHEALPGTHTLEKSLHYSADMDHEDICTEIENEELDGLWTTIYVFIVLFLLSVCYSATVTLFKVKWIFSAVLQLKPGTFHDYKNMIQQAT